MPDVAAAENPSQLAPPEPGLRHRLPHRSAGSADRIPAGTTANAGPIESTTLGRDRHRGGGHPPTPATPPCVRSVHGGSRRLRWHSSNKDGMRGGFSVPAIAPDGSAPSLPASRASPVSAEEKSSSIWVFCCLSSLRLMAYWPLLLVRAFGHRFRLGLSIAPPFGIRSASLALPTSRPNMPSADFCPAVKPPFDSLSRRSDTEQISWGTHSRFPCTVAESTLC